MLKKISLSILALVLCLMSIIVSAQAAGANITLAKSNYAPNEDIKISISGITDAMVQAGAFVGLYESGAAYNKSLKQNALKAGSNTVTIKAPATAGKYEVRVYQRGAPCLKKVSITVSAAVPTKMPTPTPKPTPTPSAAPTQSVASDPIVGIWRCDYWSMDSVIIFNEDGTFIMLSLRNDMSYNFDWSSSSVDYTSTYMYFNVEHFKGKYKVVGEEIEGTELYRYTNDVNEKDPNSVINISNIILEGSRDQILELLDPECPDYKIRGREWTSFDSRTGKLVFVDADNIKIGLFGAFNEYKRVSTHDKAMD